MRRLVVPIVLTVIISVAFIYALPNLRVAPVQASAEGQVVDDLLQFEFAIMGVIFALVMVFFFFSIVVFRRKAGETGDGEPIHGNVPLEIAWTIVPLAIVLYMGFYTAGLLNNITDTGTYDMEVEVTAAQWSWRFDYPDADVTSTELVLPVGQRVLLRMTSPDVIHSFWVPEFRVKQDIVPGIETELITTPTEVGEYTVRCAELCGLQHAYMLAPVRVLEVAEYEAWLAEQAAAEPAADPAERGQTWSVEFGCSACHSADGSVVVGPTWLGVFGSTETLDDGSTVTVDEDYIRQSILEPESQLVAGYANVMPQNYREQLTDEQIDDIIAYIQSLAE